MSEINMPKKDLGESPTTANTSSLQTSNVQSMKGGLSIGGIQITNPTKKLVTEDGFAKAIQQEYNDSNLKN